MLNENIRLNMYQLVNESNQISLKYAFEKNKKILCCFLLWAKKKNDYEDSELVTDAIRNLGLTKDFELNEFKTACEYTMDDCVTAVQDIINEDNNDRVDAEYSSSTSLDELVVKLLNLKSNESFCDFGSGEGKLLTFVAKNAHDREINCSYTGYEIVNQQVLTSKCLMQMLGIDADIINLDYAREEISKQFDKAYMFPPFGLRYSIGDWESLKGRYGNLFTSRSETELLYLLKAFENVKEDGKLIAVLPQGVAFRSSGTLAREYLVESNYIEGIISLPQRVLIGMMIPVDIWILSKDVSKEKGVKMLDATNMRKESKFKINVELDISQIMNAYEKEAKHVSSKELKEHDYSLSIGVYETAKLTKEILNPVLISDVCDIEKGSQYTKSKFEDQISELPTDYQILTSINIQNGIVDYDSLAYINPDPKLLKFKLETGDIVITTKSTVVKTFVANDLPNRNIIVTGGMIILRPNTSKVNPTYVKMFLDSSIGKNEFKSIIKGATIGFIPFNEFKDRMIISCPSLEKQNELAEQYNKMLWTINALTKQLDETKAKLENVIEDSFDEEN